jgi:hypothetical protein
MMEELTFELTLKLTLPEKTLKKLKSYAMLSGMSVDELENQLVSQVQPELSSHFDNVLTQGIVNKLGELDGVDLKTISSTDSFHEPKSDDDHQLSGDDDEGVKSLEEQVKEVPSSAQDQPFDITAPDVGDDAEQFIDAVMEPRKAVSNGQSSGMTSAGKSFNPKKPRVRISEHTGDETGSF